MREYSSRDIYLSYDEGLSRTIIACIKYALKVLSSEMDPAESRLIPQNFIKGNVAAGF